VGGDVRRLDRGDRRKSSIYYFFAREFGWTKDQVDAQPCKYLDSLIYEYREEARKERANLNRLNK
jgi:hypothetical protein